MTLKTFSIKETIEKYTNEKGFCWGTDTVMKSFADNCPTKFDYELSCGDGLFTVTKWDPQYTKPTPTDVRDEYIRQKTIAECLEYFNNINK